MVRERQRTRRFHHPAPWMFAGLLALSGAGASAHAEGGPVYLSDAAAQGAFNVNTARAAVNRVLDETAGHDVLKLDYVIPRGTAAGVWTKAFPTPLNADNADLVRLAIRAADPHQLRQISATLEIKGAAGGQRIPFSTQSVSFHPGWIVTEEMVKWQAIGTLTEVVVSVNPIGEGELATGTVYIDVCFDRLSLVRKLSMLPAARIGGVLGISLLGVVVLVWLRRAWKAEPKESSAPSDGTGTFAPETTWLGGLRRDFVLGTGVVFTAGLAIAIYLLGASGSLEMGWTALGLAAAGAVLAEWWKFGLTGRHLIAGELFQDMFVSGLLAASASSLAVLQAPTAWSVNNSTN